MTLILVVDDSHSMAEILRMSFDLACLPTRIVTDDFEGLLAATDPRWQDVTLLVCDLMLPAMSGLQIMRACRAHHPHIVIFTLTGADPDTNPDVAIAEDLADSVFHKPDDIEYLVFAAQHAHGAVGG